METTIFKPQESDEFFTPERCWILESWNKPNDGAVSIARARVKPGITTQLHRLNGVDERYLVISGSGVVKVGNLEPSEIGPGDVVAIPAGVAQQVTASKDEKLVFYCICTPRFDPDCYESLE